MTVTSKVTKRPHLKIMEKIIAKIQIKLREKMGQQYGGGLFLQALKDKQMEKQIVNMVKDEKIQLVNKAGDPVYVE